MRKLLLIIGACLALLVVAGCGDDDSTTASSTASTEETAAPEEAESTETTTEAPEKPEQSSQNKSKPKVSVPNGAPPKSLVVNDLEEGTGPAAESGDVVSVNYVGVDYKKGKQFDASWDRGEPISFPLGQNVVIKGWEKGLVGMKVGGRRELIIPPDLAYGSAGSLGIAPNETLVFVVDLEAIE